MSKTHTRHDFSRLFGIDVLWRHKWITSGMGLSHPPGWDNISPDVKIGGYACLKSEKKWPLSGALLCWRHKNYVHLVFHHWVTGFLTWLFSCYFSKYSNLSDSWGINVSSNDAYCSLTFDKTVSWSPDFLRNVAASRAPILPVPAGSAWNQHWQLSKKVTVQLCRCVRPIQIPNIRNFFVSGKFRRKWPLEKVRNFHRVLFWLFQGLSMKTYSRVYFSLCLTLVISERSRTQQKLNPREKFPIYGRWHTHSSWWMLKNCFNKASQMEAYISWKVFIYHTS